MDRFSKTCHLFADIRFYLFIKNFQLFSRICFGTKLRFSSVSFRVYQLPRYILFPELAIRFLFLRAGFLPRFKTVSITIRKGIQQARKEGMPETDTE